ncbi:S8 family serine peptidase [Peribacillus acanthi]|uniref:S8 family serine peptidase n=1 Tax=Peribacillus acanthi TaxID=2171554 RepID=UPI000D3E5984|nr:S8 family serine peptidase [Peribacillus acanthi]
MKKKSSFPFNVISTSLIAASLLFSSTSPAFGDTPPTSKITNVEQYLQYVTKQDRDRVHNSQETGVPDKYLSPTLDTISNQAVNIIVQFSQDPAKTDIKKNAEKGISLSLSEANDKVEQSHQQFKKNIGHTQKTNTSQNIKKEYRHAFNGVAMTVPAHEVQTLLSIDGVKAIYEDKQVTVEPPPVTDVEETQTKSASPALDSISHIGATKLHDEGITGKGIKVGVIDTGIDYSHPDLKDAYKGGYDFVNNDADPMETTYEEWQKSGQPELHPLGGSTYYTSHGTHVSGTIAGQGINNTDYAVTGVAPGVELYGYKVLGPYGSGSYSNIIAGIDRAVSDGMDVINLSLGSSNNDPLDPTSIAINNASLAGTVAVVAAGNAGSNLYSLGSPATSALALTVGASDYSITVPTATGTVSSSDNLSLTNLRLLAKSYSDDLSIFKTEALSIVDVGLGNQQDYTGKDVNGKIALVARGNFSLNEKVTYAKKNGAKAVLLYNNDPAEGQIPHYLGDGFEFIPAFTLTNEQGLQVKEMVKQGNATFTLNTLGELKTSGDTMAAFSSRGPSYRIYDIKPEVTAPGVGVYSSVPSYVNGIEHQGNYEYAYKRASGTSMAAPHVAGAAALLLQSHPDYKPEDVKAALMNTADELAQDYSVFEVGAGRVDVYEAVHADMSIKVQDYTPSIKGEVELTLPEVTGALSFGSQVVTKQFKKDDRNVTLSNTSSEDKTFEVQVKFNQNVPGAMDAAKNKVTLDVPERLMVKANKTLKLKPSIQVPAGAEYGNYEGFIHFTNKNNPDEVYQIPFGFKHVKEGINEVDAYYNSFTTRRDYNHGYMGYSPILFSLSSSMETVDIVLKDATTGEALGLIESFHGFLPEDILYGIEFGFVGLYFPFTGNPNTPVAYAKKLAGPGKYEVEIVATNKEGKTFKKSDPFFIENTLPEVKVQQPGGVYEVTVDGMVIKGNIYDKHVDIMKENGFDLDQSSNLLNLLNPRSTPISINKDGNFEVQTGLAAGKDFTKVTLQAIDYAMNGIQDHPDFTYTLVKKGMPYAKLVTDKNNAKYGDTVTVTLSAHNIKDLTGGEFTLALPSSIYDITHVSLNKDFTAYAEAHNIQANLTKGEVTTVGSQSRITLSAALTGEGVQPIQTSMPLIDVTLKVKENPASYIKWIQNINVTNSKAFSLNQAPVSIQGFGQGVNIVPTVSQLEGGILADGFIGDTGIWLDYNKDYSKAGMTIQAVGQDGKTYTGEFNSSARYFLKNLPTSDQPYDITVKIPGHFDRHVSISDLHDLFNGESVGRMTYIFYAPVMGGDVNNDNVIDVLDAEFIKTHWGTNNRAADINFDGVVDAKDMKFVQKHYLKQNPDVQNAPKGKEVYKGKTLEDILQELN